MSAWQTVCQLDDLQADSGVCALVSGVQIALFYMPQESVVYALSNYDPIGQANVLSRGILGDINEQPVVSSPLYKQHFNLNTGICLEDESISLAVYPVRIVNDSVQISVTETQ
jgi:nitrite reductase (NADH) small subunit